MSGKILFVLLIALALISCNSKNGTVQSGVSPLVSPINSSNELTLEQRFEDIAHTESALTAYSVAKIRAIEWNAAATLHQIAPTHQMAQNLGLTAVSSGWFFMFKVSGSPIELYVYVDGGKVFGLTEAQPIFGEQLPYKYNPIQVESIVLDSDDVLSNFLSTDKGKTWLNTTKTIPTRIDYRLVYLEGQQAPIWTLFSIQAGQTETLFHINAIDGTEAMDPFK